MATRKKKLVKSSRGEICPFCEKGFSTEKTLASHMCVKKRRYADRKTPGARLGFRVFQRFFEITTRSRNIKTEIEFIKSQYYSDFVKFGRHLVSLNPLAPDQFIDFVIENGVKLKEWTSPHVYETFLQEYIKREPAERAVERTIIEMDKWAQLHEVHYNKFFSGVSEVEATFLIRSGKISPWVLYLSDSANELLERLNREQGTIIESAINPTEWHKIFSKHEDDVKFVKSIIAKAGL